MANTPDISEQMIATAQSAYALQTKEDARVALAFLARTPWTELADLTAQQRQQGAKTLQKLSAQQGFDGLQGRSEQEILETINTLIDGNTK